MAEPRFLSREDLLLLHNEMIKEYGGSYGVRDEGLLESAIAQPQAAFAGQYLHEYPFEMAAAYLYHIVKDLFAEFVLNIAESSKSKSDAAAFLLEHSKPL